MDFDFLTFSPKLLVVYLIYHNILLIDNAVSGLHHPIVLGENLGSAVFDEATGVLWWKQPSVTCVLLLSTSFKENRLIVMIILLEAVKWSKHQFDDITCTDGKKEGIFVLQHHNNLKISAVNFKIGT
ncbi:hypothetical protein ACJX0J_031640 [Zea mays]